MLKISDLVSLLFEGLPYSKERACAQQKIEETLTEKLETADGNALQAFGSIMANWGSLKNAASLVGYSDDDIASWKSTEGITEAKQIKKLWRKVILSAWLFSIFVFLSLYLCITLITDHIWHRYLITAGSIAVTVVSFIFLRRFSKPFSLDIVRLSTDALRYLRREQDRNGKRLLNAIWIAGGVIGGILLPSAYFYFDGATLQQFVMFCNKNVFYLFIPLGLILKNALLYHFCTRTFAKDSTVSALRLHGVFIALFTLVYWISCFFLNKLADVDWVVTLEWTIFVVCAVLYILRFRSNAVRQNIVIMWKRVIALCLAGIIALSLNQLQADTWLLQPYISQVSPVAYDPDEITYSAETGVYTITTDKEDFRILQLTDIHLGGSAASLVKDEKALRACRALIEHTKPDFVMVTGDLCYPVGLFSFTLNNTAAVTEFAAFMRNIGIPWAFTYGNHDTEEYAASSRQVVDEHYKSLSWRTSGNLLYPYVQPEITGRNNQIIELRGTDGNLITNLIILDSNDYTGDSFNDYDYIHDDQVDWYARQIKKINEREGRNVPSLMFFHIPLQEYRTAADLYKKGSDDVKYFFGENKEEPNGTVSCSAYPSKLFDTAVELGSTKAMFCGHDHYNNMSLEYKGIRLTFGMSIDYLAMPGIEFHTAQRGGTLITVHKDGEFDIEQIPLNAIKTQ